jgi:hypothetical protein
VRIGASRRAPSRGAADLDQQDAALPLRREYLERLGNRSELESVRIDPRLIAPAELDVRAQQRRKDFESLEASIAGVWAQLERMEQDDQAAMNELLSPLITTRPTCRGGYWSCAWCKLAPAWMRLHSRRSSWRTKTLC